MTKFLLPALFISIIGIFNIFGINQNLVNNQIFFVVAGLIAFFLTKKIGRNFFLSNSKVFYWLFVAILVITFIIGLEVKGSKRWIDLYFFKFQASEIFKAFFILFLSDFLVKDFKIIDPVRSFFKTLIYFLIPAFIIFKQPDLGNTMVYFFIYITLILFSGLPKKYIAYFLIILIITLPIGWNFMRDYQKARITSFFNPQIDEKGTAYNMTQAIITAGSGKFLGRGLGLGTQSRLYFLPENHTDFAFSSLTEQFGFVGGFFTILLYISIVTFLIGKLIKLHFLRGRQDNINFLYVAGFLAYFCFQILVNIAMNLGLFPITGIALPFISYGGSSFVALMIGIALIP